MADYRTNKLTFWGLGALFSFFYLLFDIVRTRQVKNVEGHLRVIEEDVRTLKTQLAVSATRDNAAFDAIRELVTEVRRSSAHLNGLVQIGRHLEATESLMWSLAMGRQHHISADAIGSHIEEDMSKSDERGEHEPEVTRVVMNGYSDSL
ncbi:hypothetical protein VTI74DRAFT_5110 [Chaetomium olivicolor]